MRCEGTFLFIVFLSSQHWPGLSRALTGSMNTGNNSSRILSFCTGQSFLSFFGGEVKLSSAGLLSKCTHKKSPHAGFVVPQEMAHVLHHYCSLNFLYAVKNNLNRNIILQNSNISCTCLRRKQKSVFSEQFFSEADSHILSHWLHTPPGVTGRNQ